MLLICISKPDVVYDNDKNEFRQFGTTAGKTLLPIYVVGMLLAIILYVFFYYLSQQCKTEDHVSLKQKTRSNSKIENINVDMEDTRYIQQQLQQQLQLQNIQNQLNQLAVQQQISTHLTNTNKSHLSGAILPNCLNV